MMDEDHTSASKTVQRRMDASIRAEKILRGLSEHQDADLLRELRLGYRAAIETAKRLYRDNMALRGKGDV